MAHRLMLLRAAMVVAFLLILGRLVQLQVAGGARNRQLADENRIRIIRRLAPRGTIYDRHGRVLATSRLAFSLCAVPEELSVAGYSDPAVGLAATLDLPLDELRAALDQPRAAQYEPLVLWRDASPEVVARVEENAVYLSGLTVAADAVRYYPRGSLAAQVLGYVREIAPEELGRIEYAHYRPRDLVGKSGIERAAELALHGADGGEQIEVDARGRRVRTLGRVPPRRGRNIWLTLDVEVQRAAEEALGDRPGAVVALDPETGDVLAMASHPRYDPNLFSRTVPSRLWRRLSGPARPLQNRAISCLYEPGSVFKIITAAAALEGGDVSLHETFHCSGAFRLGGWQMRCWKRDGHGTVDFLRGFGQSCNVMFATLGRRVGPDALAAMARRFGLGQRTGVDLPEEAEGLVPTPGWKRRVRKQPWYPGDTPQMAIGQAQTLVTPLQVAREAAAVANGGYLVTPRVIARIEGEDAKAGLPPKRSLHLSVDTLAALRAGMEAVVAEGGTAHRVWSADYGIAGKTGTAQNPRGKPHAWFAGYAPTDRPRLAVAVIVENAGGGAAVAAPIARHVFDALLLPPSERTPWPSPATVAARPSHPRGVAP